MLRRWLRALALALVYLLLACGGTTEPEPACGGEMCPAFYRTSSGTQIESRITIANYDGETPWYYEIIGRQDTLVDTLVTRTVQQRQVSHAIGCGDVSSTHGLTQVTWTVVLQGDTSRVASNLNC